MEYALALDPSGPDNPDGLPTFSTSGGDSYLVLTQRSNALDVTFLLETSETIGSWIPMVQPDHYTLKTETTDSPERTLVSLKLVDTDPWRFYRQGFQVIE